jgi:flagellar assembly protein FliH
VRKKIIYKLATVGETLVLESRIPPEVLSYNKNIDADGNEEDQLETKLHESYQKGWNEASKKIKDETKKDIELTCQVLHKAISDLKQERNDIWKQCEKEIVRLSLAVAKKAAFHEISKHGSEIINKVVNEAFSNVKDKEILKLHLNPEDIEKLKQQGATNFIDANNDYQVVGDSNITSGGCKIVTDFGSVDARVETRWNEIEVSFEENTLEAGPEINEEVKEETKEEENEST